jgi:hypothetical protein
MIFKREKKNGVTIYHVKKDFDDNKLKSKMGKKLKRSDIKEIIHDDADVYTEDGSLLLRFRKDKLKKKNIDDFYENVIEFAKKKTTTRGMASGIKNSHVATNKPTMTNIIGYFDSFSPIQKHKASELGMKLPLSVRETAFLMDFPEKYKKLIPLVKQIDDYYKQYVPEKYAKQRKKAHQTPFKIRGTSFTTITTNVNFQTGIHTDKGDDAEGFGNLCVIEYGKYKGGETCFPQYGVGVNIRTCDVLYMDVHHPHANLPIELETPDSVRLSIVCYLRTGIWEKTKNKTKKFLIQHNKTIRKLRDKPAK